MDGTMIMCVLKIKKVRFYFFRKWIIVKTFIYYTYMTIYTYIILHEIYNSWLLYAYDGGKL